MHPPSHDADRQDCDEDPDEEGNVPGHPLAARELLGRWPEVEWPVVGQQRRFDDRRDGWTTLVAALITRDEEILVKGIVLVQLRWGTGVFRRRRWRALGLSHRRQRCVQRLAAVWLFLPGERDELSAMSEGRHARYRGHRAVAATRPGSGLDADTGGARLGCCPHGRRRGLLRFELIQAHLGCAHPGKGLCDGLRPESGVPFVGLGGFHWRQRWPIEPDQRLRGRSIEAHGRQRWT